MEKEAWPSLERRKEREMKNPNSHIYLYAKGWYKEANLVDDLKKLVGLRCSVGPEYISEYDILSVLLSITWPHLLQSGNPELQFKEFVLGLEESQYWKLDMRGKWSFNKALIRMCLSALRFTKVIDGEEVFIELDDPDPSILPLRP